MDLACLEHLNVWSTVSLPYEALSKTNCQPTVTNLSCIKVKGSPPTPHFWALTYIYHNQRTMLIITPSPPQT